MLVLAALCATVALAESPDTVSIEVLDVGKEPRIALAVAPAAGTVETVGIDMSFTADVVNEGIALPTHTMPTLHLTLRSEVAEADDRGFRAAITVPRVTVGGAGESTDELRAATQEAVAPMTQLHGMVTIDPFGAPVTTQWSTTGEGAVNPNLVAELERAIELLQIRRPPEPLGVRARWTVTRMSTDELGYSVTDVETWTVADRKGDGWALDLTAIQRAEVPQAVGAHTLESHTGAAQGRAILDPAHLHPAMVELGLSLRTRMLLEGTITSTTTSTLTATATRQP